MFKISNEYLGKEISTGGNAILKSGAFEVSVESATILKSNESFSEAINFEFVNILEEKAKVTLWYKDKEGNDLEFNTKHINDFMFLLGIKMPLTDEKDGVIHITNFEKKVVGVLITYKGSEKYTGKDGKEYTRHNYILRGFYDVSTKKTAKEKNNNEEPKIYDKWVRNFENENLNREAKQKSYQHKNKKNPLENAIDKMENEDEDDQDFPF